MDGQEGIGDHGEARCKITMNGKWLEYERF